MVSRLKKWLKALAATSLRQNARHETQLLAIGKLLSWHSRSRRDVAALAEVEFKVFSQFGDDGIIQWLTGHLDIEHRFFIEFGVENYRESNTRFLMMNDNWSGYVMDGSPAAVQEIVASEYYWRHDLRAVSVFVDRENISGLISAAGFPNELGLLHIDVDGNDYWIWKALDQVRPVIAVIEYNSVFGPDRPITIPYQNNFIRNSAHFSNLYWGTSLGALYRLAMDKGYRFVGCNSAGNNAYFVRADKLNAVVREVSLEKGFVSSKYREGRGQDGRLAYHAGDARAEVIRGLPVHNVVTGMIEPF